VIRAGHAVSDMAYLAARDADPAGYCVSKIAQSDVYIGIIGLRYGELVRGCADRSYTELEFDTATELGLIRLIFLVREDARSLPLASQQPEHRARQDAFRRRLLQSAGTVAWVASPGELELALLHALVELRAESDAGAGVRSGSDSHGVGAGSARAPRRARATHLRNERRRRGWTHADIAVGLRALAEELGEPAPDVDDDRVDQWEVGLQGPGPFARPRLCLLFDLSPLALGFELTPRLLGDVRRLSIVRMKRRQFLTMTAAALVGGAAPGGALGLERLAAAAGAAPQTRLPLPPAWDGRPAEYFLRVRKALADNDNLLGPRQVIPAATTQVGAMQRLRSSLRGSDLRELLQVQTQFADLLGWLHQDSGNLPASEYWMDRALEWAHLAADHESIVFVLARKSQLAGDVRDPIGAVDVADAAMKLAGPRSRLAAVAATYAAHGHALRGDRASCERLYAHAASVLEHAEPDDSPWGLFFDAPYIAVHRARSVAILGDHRAAADGFRAAIDSLQRGYHRDRGVYLAREALAHAGSGDPEHAAALGLQSLAIGIETRSGRIFTELASLDGALHRWKLTSNVMRFHSAITDTVPRQA
jgi:hypothetical protein